MIREATLDDVPRLVEMGCEFINGSRYRAAVKPDPASIAQMIRGLIELPYGLVLVSDMSGEVTGMIGVIATMHPMSSEAVMSEMFWYVTPEHRGHGVRLLKAAEAWGRAHGVKKAIMISPTKKVSAFYRRAGYSLLETQFIKSL